MIMLAGCAAPDVQEKLDATIRYHDVHGYVQEIRVERALAREIARVLVAARRADAKWAARHVTFTDIAAEGTRPRVQPRARASQAGNPWEGPRFSFPILLGLREVWSDR